MTPRRPAAGPVATTTFLLHRALAYSLNVHRWMSEQHYVERGDPGDPRAVISWFAWMISAKIGRALSSRAYADPDDPDCPRDHDGSADAAWLRLADAGSSAFTFIRHPRRQSTEPRPPASRHVKAHVRAQPSGRMRKGFRPFTR